MKQRISAAVTLAALSLFAMPTMAGLTASLSGGHGDNFPIGQGGYYWVYRSGDMSAWNAFGLTSDFHTFCVEQRVFSPGTTYNVTIDDQVLQQGPKPIQPFTKSIYANYVLAPDSAIGQNTIGDDPHMNRALQALIWDSQGTITGVAGQIGGTYANNAFAWLTSDEQSAYGAFNAFVQSDLRASDLWMVKALNLWTGDPYTGGDNQSQLCLVVPAPVAALLGVIGLGLVGSIKRRMS